MKKANRILLLAFSSFVLAGAPSFYSLHLADPDMPLWTFAALGAILLFASTSFSMFAAALIDRSPNYTFLFVPVAFVTVWATALMTGSAIFR